MLFYDQIRQRITQFFEQKANQQLDNTTAGMTIESSNRRRNVNGGRIFGEFLTNDQRQVQ
jgi:hypothetical protein